MKTVASDRLSPLDVDMEREGTEEPPFSTPVKTPIFPTDSHQAARAGRIPQQPARDSKLAKPIANRGAVLPRFGSRSSPWDRYVAFGLDRLAPDSLGRSPSTGDSMQSLG